MIPRVIGIVRCAAVCSCLCCAVLSAGGAVYVHWLPRVVSYDQWLILLAFKILLPGTVLASVCSLVSVPLFCRHCSRWLFRLCMICALIVGFVFLTEWSSMDEPRVNNSGACYLNMALVEKSRSELRYRKMDPNIGNVTALLGYKPECSSGGRYIWPSTDGVIQCTLHGMQYPRWYVWVLKSPCWPR